MPRQRNPDRDKALEIFIEHNGNITNREIAKRLNVPERTISVWKIRDKWNEKINCSTSKKKCSTTKKKRGGQPGNKNAVGHGAPVGNKNAEKHGFFSKYLPEETLEIMQEIQEKDPLDLLWENIVIQYTAIIRAQKIMYVKDQNDKTIEKVGYKKGKVVGEDWQIQQAWDKQATFLKAQSRAMAELRSMIKQYDELLKSGLATEEQKLRIEKLKVEVNALKGGSVNNHEAINEFIQATTIKPNEVKDLFKGEDNENNEE